jgi:hypothetical protein
MSANADRSNYARTTIRHLTGDRRVAAQVPKAVVEEG